MTLFNPLVSGFHPDPSVVRVGDEWFLATSTFEYLPGIPIHRSRDFETWELIGHVATRPGQLAVENVPTAGGAWAPTIRHRDGVFHLVITDAMGRGMLHFTATDAAGPWSDGDVILDVAGEQSLAGIDPDIAWDDDGTVYITYSGLVLGGMQTATHATTHRGIQQVRVDLDAHRALEEPRSLWSGTGLKMPEAPHLYAHDGAWYLLIAEGGTARGHGVSVARGDSPEGPFHPAPNNPILSERSTASPVQSTGHADLTIGPDGEWLAVLLGVRPRSTMASFSALGRETFVCRARWVDGWPQLDPVALHPRGGTRVDLAFDAALDDEWIGVRRSPQEIADLDTHPGRLTLHADGSTLDDPRPVFVGRRQEHLRQHLTVRCDVSRGVGGLSARYDEAFHVDLEAHKGVVIARAAVGGVVQEWEHPFDGTVIDLHFDDVRPETSLGLMRTSDVIRLSAMPVDGPAAGVRIELAEIDGRFLSAEMCESFTGRALGVYASAGEVVIERWTSEGDDE